MLYFDIDINPTTTIITTTNIIQIDLPIMPIFLASLVLLREMKILFQKILLAFFLFSTSSLALGQDIQELPALESQVTDYTSTLTSSEISSLENYLSKFEKEKGSQVAVLVISTTEPEEIEAYGIRLAEKWKIGRKNVGDGVILIVAKDDRKLRIEVGYGLEGAIPDIYAKRIIENIILPTFRQGNFYEGIKHGVNAIVSLINKEELPAVTSEHIDTNEVQNNFFSIGFFLLIIGASIIKAFVKNSKVKVGIAVVFSVVIWLLLSSLIGGILGFIFTGVFLFSKSNGRNRGGGYYAGGSFGGGSSFGGGGFSGGGGGFGGGGASGGW